MSLADLLCDEGEKEKAVQTDYMFDEKHMIEVFRKSDHETKRRIINYLEHLILKKNIELSTGNVSIITDAEGNITKLNMDGIVMIPGLLFRNMIMMENWQDKMFLRGDL